MWIVGFSLIFLFITLNAVAAGEDDLQRGLNKSGKVDFTERERAHSIKRRSLDKPFTILVTYDNKTIPLLKPATIDYLKQVLMPAVTTYFKNTLKSRLHSQVKLFRECIEHKSIFTTTHGITTKHCPGGCAPITKCRHIVIPDSHIEPCYTKPHDLTPRETNAVDVDFYLYVSAAKLPQCVTGNDQVVATTCQLHWEFQRPMAGVMTFCPDYPIGVNPAKRHLEIAIAKRQTFRMLGFQPSMLFKFFYNHEGKPRATRHPKTGKPVSETAYEKLLKRVERPKWKVKSGETNHTFNTIITPAVLREARRHFDCPDLEGAEMNNQTTFWAKRVFGNEGMTGELSEYPVFSRITLALMEDSGWYKVNWANAEKLQFGHHAGCAFAKHSCMEYMKTRRAANKPVTPYCDSFDKTRLFCSLRRDSISICDMMQHTKELPVQFQHVDKLPTGFNENLTSFYGGKSKSADYCPMLTPYLINTTTEENLAVRCDNADLQPNADVNYHQETYGPNSKCLEHALRWTTINLQSKTNSTVGGAGCYEIDCGNATQLEVSIIVGGTTYPCAQAGDIVNISEQLNSSKTVLGTVVCPPYDDVCGSPMAKQYVDDIPWDTPVGILSCKNISCLNGGICRDLVYGIMCICLGGYSGERCEEEHFTLPAACGTVIVEFGEKLTEKPTKAEHADDHDDHVEADPIFLIVGLPTLLVVAVGGLYALFVRRRFVHYELNKLGNLDTKSEHEGDNDSLEDVQVSPHPIKKKTGLKQMQKNV